jgi:hypothetical protein
MSKTAVKPQKASIKQALDRFQASVTSLKSVTEHHGDGTKKSSGLCLIVEKSVEDLEIELKE